MASLNDLKDLGNEAIGEAQDLAGLPEQFGGQYPDPPQPGDYAFRLPALSQLQTAFDTVDSAKGKRVKVLFRDGAELVITQSPGGQLNGETFSTQLTNVERRRGKEGPEASDWDYLLAALDPKAKKPTDNKGYIVALQQHPAKEFKAAIEWNWSCNPEKPIRVDMGENGIVVQNGENGTELKKGCGKRYYQKDVDKVEGKYPREISCECGAILRGFANLTRFRPIGG